MLISNRVVVGQHAEYCGSTQNLTICELVSRGCCAGDQVVQQVLQDADAARVHSSTASAIDGHCFAPALDSQYMPAETKYGQLLNSKFEIQQHKMQLKYYSIQQRNTTFEIQSTQRKTSKAILSVATARTTRTHFNIL